MFFSTGAFTAGGVASVATGPDIALFLTSFAGGGAEKVTLTLAREFASRKLRVDLVVARAEGALADQVPPTVQVIDLGARRILFSLPALTRYMRTRRPTAFLSPITAGSVIAALARSLARVPMRLVVCQHSDLGGMVQAGANGHSRSFLKAVRRAHLAADHSVAISEGVAADLVRLGVPRKQISLCRNPIDLEAIGRLAALPPETYWSESDRRPIFLGVGRLTKEKDFPTLIRAFARVRSARPARLVILGEGDERAALEALVTRLGLGDDVRLPGFVGNPYAHMRNAEVFVLSSLAEGFGLVVAEALACGTRVVSTDCPSGPRDILENGRLGALVPVGDAEALAAAMEAALGAEAHPIPDLQRFDPSTVAEQYLRLLLP